jgi:cytochrome c oxidase subunit 4
MSSSPGSGDSHAHHISSPLELISIFVSLLLLTALTVMAASWPVGEWDIWVAMGIAGVKATLVAGWFMHLKYDHPTNAILLIFSVLVVVLFLGLTMSDTMQLVPEVEAANEANASAAPV